MPAAGDGTWPAATHRRPGTPCQLALAQEVRRGILHCMRDCSVSLRKLDAPREGGGGDGAEDRAREIAWGGASRTRRPVRILFSSTPASSASSRSPSPSASEVEMLSHVASLVEPSEISGSSVFLDAHGDDPPSARRRSPITLTLGAASGGSSGREQNQGARNGWAGDPALSAQGRDTTRADGERGGREGRGGSQYGAADPATDTLHLWLEAQLLPPLPSGTEALRAAVNACVQTRRVLVAWHAQTAAARAGKYLARWAHLRARAHLHNVQGRTWEASLRKMRGRWKHTRLRCGCARWRAVVDRRRQGARLLLRMWRRWDRIRTRSVFLRWRVDVACRRRLLSRAHAFHSRALRGLLCLAWDCLVTATPRERMRIAQAYADCHQLPFQLQPTSVYLQGASQTLYVDTDQRRANVRVQQRATQTALMAWDPLAATIRCFETRELGESDVRKLEASIATSHGVIKRARAVVLRERRPLLDSFRSWTHTLHRGRALERWHRDIAVRLRWHRGRRAAQAWHFAAALSRSASARLSTAHSMLSRRRTRALVMSHFGHWAALRVLLVRLRSLRASSALAMQSWSFSSWNAAIYGRVWWGGKAGGRSGQQRRVGLLVSALQCKCSGRMLRECFGAWEARFWQRRRWRRVHSAVSWCVLCGLGCAGDGDIQGIACLYSLSLTHTHTRTLSLSLTHTNTLTFSLSLSLSLSAALFSFNQGR